MADQNDTNEAKKTKAQELLADIAAKVKDSGPAVVEKYIAASVQKEIDSRVDLLDKAIQKRFELLGALGKVNRPDVVTYDAEGKEASGTYTKPRLEEIKKAKEALEKHENALEKALISNDWSKLKGG